MDKYNDNMIYTLDRSDGESPVRVFGAAEITLSKVAHTEEQKRAALLEVKNWKITMKTKYYHSLGDSALRGYDETNYEKELDRDELHIVTKNGVFAGFLGAAADGRCEPCPLERGKRFWLLLTPYADPDGLFGSCFGGQYQNDRYATLYIKRR